MTWVLPWKEPGVEGREAGTGRGRKCCGPSGRGAHVTLNYIPMQPVALEGGPSPKKEK